MPQVTVTKEALWRAQVDEYAVVTVQRVTRITDDEGAVTERYWRRAVTPDDPVDDLPPRLQVIIGAARYPEALARWEARKAEQG